MTQRERFEKFAKDQGLNTTKQHGCYEALETIFAWRVWQAACPEGWQAVPKEADSNMLDAAREWSSRKYGKPVGNDASNGCYTCMLAAAPTPGDQ